MSELATPNHTLVLDASQNPERRWLSEDGAFKQESCGAHPLQHRWQPNNWLERSGAKQMLPWTPFLFGRWNAQMHRDCADAECKHLCQEHSFLCNFNRSCSQGTGCCCGWIHTLDYQSVPRPKCYKLLINSVLAPQMLFSTLLNRHLLNSR